MDVGSAFAEYFERESRRRNDGREPSILPNDSTVSYIFFPPPYFLDLSSAFSSSGHLLFTSTSTSLSFCFRFFSLLSPSSSFFTENSIARFCFLLHPILHPFLFRAVPPSTRAEDRRAYIGQLPVVSPPPSPCSHMLLKQLWTFLSFSLLPLFSHPLAAPFSFFHSLFSLFPLGLTAAHASDHPGCKKRRVVWTGKRLIFIRSLSFSIVTLDTLCSLFSLSLSYLFFAR